MIHLCVYRNLAYNKDTVTHQWGKNSINGIRRTDCPLKLKSHSHITKSQRSWRSKLTKVLVLKENILGRKGFKQKLFKTHGTKL